VRGDVLITTDGKRFEGQVYTEGGQVWVRTPNCRLGFEPSEVKETKSTPTIFDAYRARLAAVKKDDLAGNEALLKWCEANGLREEKLEQARRVFVLRLPSLVINPLDRTAAENLALWCQYYELKPEAKKLFLLLYNAELNILRALRKGTTGHDFGYARFTRKADREACLLNQGSLLSMVSASSGTSEEIARCSFLGWTRSRMQESYLNQ
jgi:hypothetical protein